MVYLARPERLELPTRGLGNRCSIRLSYGRRIIAIRILHFLSQFVKVQKLEFLTYSFCFDSRYFF
ncbi:hypothetical protein SCFA_340008 [anaerobic digester metagenome]|uniref:Uncharacterized protein n=1 Tax=anaerobic digester metagenome TaxID=1263854 RepID=A0A485M9C1_9ZZZZ